MIYIHIKKHGSPLGHVVIVKDNNPCPYTITSGVKSKDSTKNPKFCLCVVQLLRNKEEDDERYCSSSYLTAHNHGIIVQ